jgi:dienelactone hydrolase
MRIALLLVTCALLAGGCASTQHVTITATPRTTLLDEPVSIRVAGAKPGSLLSLRLSENGWVGRGVYRVPHDGTVDVARAASLAGTYLGRERMGLFWSMAPSPSGTRLGPYAGGSMTLTASIAGRRRASATLVRRLRAPGVTVRATTIARDGFYGAYDTPPPGVERGAPVLVFGGSEGGLVAALPAALLASHGHPALAIAYFDEPGLPQSLERIPLDYFARAARWLDRQPGVDGSRLVVWGTSRGSEAALELGVHYPGLVHGVIGGVASAVVYPGFTSADAASAAPAWTLHGRPIPAGSIPIERVRGPIFVYGGGDDTLWPSYAYVPEIARRSEDEHGPPVTAIVYPLAGHGVGLAIPNLPFPTTFVSHGATLSLGGSEAANQAAMVRLWPRLLRFLAVVPGR